MLAKLLEGLVKNKPARLRQYLSTREPQAVTIRVVRHDSEAMEYAAQIFNAMRQTSWDLDPPNHGGPESFTMFRRQRRPMPNDTNSTGKAVYKTDADYRDAYEAWLQTEFENRLGEELWDANGVCVDVYDAGQPHNPDPRYPPAADILRDAFRYAGVEANCSGGMEDTGHDTTFISVGHRPRQIGQGTSMRAKIGQWVMQHLIFPPGD